MYSVILISLRHVKYNNFPACPYDTETIVRIEKGTNGLSSSFSDYFRFICQFQARSYRQIIGPCQSTVMELLLLLLMKIHGVVSRYVWIVVMKLGVGILSKDKIVIYLGIRLTMKCRTLLRIADQHSTQLLGKNCIRRFGFFRSIFQCRRLGNDAACQDFILLSDIMV